MNSPEGFSVQSVANDLEKCLTLQDKLTVLSKACHGLDAVILTAGPSLSRYTPKQLVDICRNKIVICVKQSIDICPVHCHFHLLNHINYKAYRYTDHRPIVLFESREGEDPGIENGVWDLHFKVDLRATQEGVWLANTRNFDDFLFSQSLIRPWGPGILYEIGFYLVVHLALRSVHVIGWDMSMDSRGTTNHFYDSFATKMKKRLKGWFLSKEANRRVNGSTDGEYDAVAKSTTELYTWLKSKNVELSLPIENRRACSSIPRVVLK